MMTSSFIDIADANPDEIANHINETQTRYFKENITPLIEVHLLGEALYKENFGEASAPDMDEKSFINGGFMTLFNNIFYREEQSLVLRLSNESEHIKFGFAFYALLGDESRFLSAQNSVAQQRKAAWEYAGFEYPFGELDNQTYISRNKIAASVFPNTASQAHPYAYHNIAETITGILDNNDAIVEDEKDALRNLATFLITSGAPQESANCGIQSPNDMGYDQKDECHDLAYIETAIEALYIKQNEEEKNEDNFGDSTVSKDLHPFWRNTYNELRTDEARAYFSVLKELNEKNTPLLLPDTMMDHVQEQVLTRGTEGTHPPNHGLL